MNQIVLTPLELFHLMDSIPSETPDDAKVSIVADEKDLKLFIEIKGAPNQYQLIKHIKRVV